MSAEPAAKDLTHNKAQIKITEGGFETPNGTYVHEPPGQVEFRAKNTINEFVYKPHSPLVHGPVTYRI